jgi:hypothetical protein
MLQHHGSLKHRYMQAQPLVCCALCLYVILDYPGICPIVEEKDRKFVKLLLINLNIHNNPAESVDFRFKLE